MDVSLSHKTVTSTWGPRLTIYERMGKQSGWFKFSNRQWGVLKRTMFHFNKNSITDQWNTKLLLGRNIRTQLDLIKPVLSAKVSLGQNKMKLSICFGIREFNEGLKLWSEIIGMQDAVGFLMRYSLGLDLFLTPLIQDMVLFGDVMQTNFVLKPVIPKLILKFRILSRVFRQFMIRMINRPSVRMCQNLRLCQIKPLCQLL